MARRWRATRVEHVATAEQTGAHEVGGGSISFARGVRVQLQDEPGRGMAEAVLRSAQIDPGSDPRRRGGVAQPVEGELLELGLAYCRQPHALTEVRVEQRPALGCGEDPRVGVSSGQTASAQVLGDRCHQLRRRSDGSAPGVGLGLADVERTAHLSHVEPHRHRAPQRVDVSNLEPGALAPPEAQLAGDEHHRPVFGRDCVGEAVDLVGPDDDSLLRCDAGQLDAPARRARNQVGVQRPVEDRAQHGVVRAGGRGCEALRELVDELLHVERSQRAERPGAERRYEMQPDRIVSPHQRLRTSAAGALSPALRPVLERRRREPWVDPGAAAAVGDLTGFVRVGLSARSERALVVAAVGRTQTNVVAGAA